MTVEIRELVVQVRVTDDEKDTAQTMTSGLSDWDEQRLMENVKREVLEALLERGRE